MKERALLLMREYGIETVFVVSGGDPTADKVDAFEITRDDVAQDADTAALVFAIITRHDPTRLAAMVPMLLVSTKLVEEIVAELDRDRS